VEQSEEVPVLLPFPLIANLQQLENKCGTYSISSQLQTADSHYSIVLVLLAITVTAGT
jgi:hypothetical protein